MIYDPLFRISLFFIGVLLVVFQCAGCAGFTNNAKSIQFQIPALLNVEFEYNDQKGVTPPTDQKGLLPITHKAD
jgi:hypothetical protein